MIDIVSRSLAHWSEERRAEMDAFYRLATKDYRHLAEARDWAAWLAERSDAAGRRPLRLLDVACGSGKFPTALIEHAGVGRSGLNTIEYDLLDPSTFSVAEARAALRPPFQPAVGHVCTLQDFDCRSGHYDIVWATHALYALPREELAAGLSRFVDCVAEGGSGFIAHASEASHYLTFYRAYLDGFEQATDEPYISSADLIETLEQLGVQFGTEEITYYNGAPDAERDAVEGYLQRCLFDDTVTLEALLENPSTGPYLADKLNDGEWRFPQSVTLIDLRSL